MVEWPLREHQFLRVRLWDRHSLLLVLVEYVGKRKHSVTRMLPVEPLKMVDPVYLLGMYIDDMQKHLREFVFSEKAKGNGHSRS